VVLAVADMDIDIDIDEFSDDGAALILEKMGFKIVPLILQFQFHNGHASA
jgi:hypothetical protein